MRNNAGAHGMREYAGLPYFWPFFILMVCVNMRVWLIFGRFSFL